MEAREQTLTQLNIPALLISQSDDVQLWDIAPEMEEIDSNHEVWEVCSNCGGWVDLRGGECPCRVKTNNKIKL